MGTPAPAAGGGPIPTDRDDARALRALLVTQGLGAFNDNAWKMFVVVLGGRALAGLSGAELEAADQARTMLAFVVFTLPLLLVSLPAGLIADRFGKRSVIVGLKALELALMAAGTLALALVPEGTFLPLVVLGLMGVQSALFSPAKYGVVPELVPHPRLSAANGALEAATFVAIVAGTALGPVLLPAAPGALWVGGLALGVLALAGLLAARRLPALPAARSGARLGETIAGAWSAVRADRRLLLTIVGAAWFWTVASLLGQDLIVYWRRVLGQSEAGTGLPFALFGVGVGAGSWLAGRLSEDKVEMGLIPLGAAGLSLFTLLLGGLAPGVTLTLALMAALGLSSGFLVVPLDALLQWRAPADRRGAVIALANVFAFGGMLLGSLVGALLAVLHVSSRGILVGAALITLAGTVWSLTLLPAAFVRLNAFLFTHLVYRVTVLGRDHVPRQGGVLLAPNHVSWVDGLLLMASLDRPIRFLIEQEQFDRPWLRPLLRIMGAIPIPTDGGVRGTLAALREGGRALDAGEVVCLFPEGQITRTGTLQPFRRGLERLARGHGAPVVPAHLDRVWGSIFSFAGGRFVRKLPEELPYPVTVSFGESLPANTPRSAVQRAVQALGERAWYERKARRLPLHGTFVSVARRRPWRLALVDGDGRRLSRLGALAGAVALARTLRGPWAGARTVGILLPPGVGGALVNLAASLSGRASVNLNFTAGRAGMASAARQAGLRRVVTSRTFLERAGLALPEGVEPIWIEDVVGAIRRRTRLLALVLAAGAPLRRLERACGAVAHPGPDDLATVIFSSGSTGEPKGVMLSHFNLDSNVEAAAQVFRLGPHDRLLGILPLFHAFGFMALWFALNRGAPIVFQPDPLDGAAVGRLVHEHGVTMLLATPTFLQVYLRRCSPQQFGSLRLVLAGAEKLPEALARRFEDTFGIRPLEGYGATECAPVIASGVPGYRARGFFQAGSRRGTVGLPLPGVAVRVVHPESGAPVPPGDPGLLLVKGPNVMVGYLGRPDLTAQAFRDGWYVTGDMATVDEDGFLTITGRLARFSKIGGEMVPHGRVEQALEQAWGEDGEGRFGVTAVPDARKGERLAVVTTVAPDAVDDLLDRLREADLPNLWRPRRDVFVHVDELPKLGTGKLDLRALQALAEERLGGGAAPDAGGGPGRDRLDAGGGPGSDAPAGADQPASGEDETPGDDTGSSRGSTRHPDSSGDR